MNLALWKCAAPANLGKTLSRRVSGGGYPLLATACPGAGAHTVALAPGPTVHHGDPTFH